MLLAVSPIVPPTSPILPDGYAAQFCSLTIDLFTIFPTDTVAATTSKALPVRLLAQLARMPAGCPKICAGLSVGKNYFDSNIWTFGKCYVGQLVYVDGSPLINSPTNCIADRYDKLLPRAYGLFRRLQVTEQTLMVDESGTNHTNSV